MVRLLEFLSPLLKQKNSRIYQLKPWVMLAYNNQEHSASGDYFTNIDELSFGNVELGKKYISLSESELGFSPSFGLDYEIKFNDKKRLSMSFSSYIPSDATYLATNRNGLEPWKSFIFG